MKCLKCDGSRIVEGVLDSTSGIGLRIPKSSPSQWFKNTTVENVFNICIDCGDITMVATNLPDLQSKVESLGIGFKE